MYYRIDLFTVFTNLPYQIVLLHYLNERNELLVLQWLLPITTTIRNLVNSSLDYLCLT